MSKVHCVSNMAPATVAAIVSPICPGRPSSNQVCCDTPCGPGGGGGGAGVCPTPMTRLFCFCENVIPSADKGRCPGPGDNVSFYTQVIVDGECEIPEPKPNAEKLLKVHNSVRVIKAVTVDSKEVVDGDFVDGRKVLIAGFLHLGFEYSACTPDQKVHFFHCDIPFDGLILDTDGGLLPDDFNLDDYIVHACVEQIQVQQTGPRTFSKVAILLIWLEPRV